MRQIFPDFGRTGDLDRIWQDWVETIISKKKSVMLDFNTRELPSLVMIFRNA